MGSSHLGHCVDLGALVQEHLYDAGMRAGALGGKVMGAGGGGFIMFCARPEALALLKRAVQQGLDSGEPSDARDPATIKAEGRRRLALLRSQ
jgi:galactokinase/mevalonate kinase-like predicted kinase